MWVTTLQRLEMDASAKWDVLFFDDQAMCHISFGEGLIIECTTAELMRLVAVLSLAIGERPRPESAAFQPALGDVF
jgi:hypothetical protein